MQITNVNDVSLALAVWMVNDDYDHINEPNYISATALMKPLRHIILGARVVRSGMSMDVEGFAARALGHSIHDSIEKAWTKGYDKNLRLLGYPQDVIDRIRINPTDDEVRASNSIIPIYLEQRAFREHMGYTIGGKFDMVTEGVVQDAKSTSAYTWLMGGKDDDYKLQMSLYRWLDAARPLRRITEDFGRINFIFTDWQKSQAKSNPKYPQKRVEYREIPLMSLRETEEWVTHKLNQIAKNQTAAEPSLPYCTDEELWRSDPQYKYYSDASKTTGRSTRNFDTAQDANTFMAEKGKGAVVTVPGSPKRCGYCEAYALCSQKDQWVTP
jgi:hypothetical protein